MKEAEKSNVVNCDLQVLRTQKVIAISSNNVFWKKR